MWHCGHAYQEVCATSHSLTIRRTCVFLQLVLSDVPLLEWPRAVWEISKLEVIPLTCLNEEHFGLPCQCRGIPTSKGLRHMLKEHFLFVNPIDTSQVSMGQYAYHLRSQQDTTSYKLCEDF